MDGMFDIYFAIVGGESNLKWGSLNDNFIENLAHQLIYATDYTCLVNMGVFLC